MDGYPKIQRADIARFAARGAGCAVLTGDNRRPERAVEEEYFAAR